MIPVATPHKVTFHVDPNMIDANGLLPALAAYAVGPFDSVEPGDMVDIIDDDNSAFKGSVQSINRDLYLIRPDWSSYVSATGEHVDLVAEGTDVASRFASSSAPIFFGVDFAVGALNTVAAIFSSPCNEEVPASTSNDDSVLIGRPIIAYP